MSAREEDLSDDVRKLIFRRAKELGLSWTDLSKSTGRNLGYIHSFLFRDIPKRLAENDRKQLAGALRVTEESLRHSPAATTSPDLGFHPMVKAIPHHGRSSDAPVHIDLHGQDIPAFSDQGEIDRSRPHSFVPRPNACMRPSETYAIWISTSWGRLRPGDLAYADLTRPPRVGDVVVAIQEASILAIGDLTALSSAEATIEVSSDHEVVVSRSVDSLHKVRWLQLA